MATTLGERIRAARENKSLLQADLAKMIGAKSAGVISNWEKDLSKPDANKLVRLCKALDVSASYLLDYYGDEDFEAMPHEINIIKDFRKLDAHGKEVVLYLLRKELQRCSASSVKEEEAKSIPPADQDIHNIKRPVISEKEIFEFLDSDEPATLNAARERTDIEVTDDMKKHDDDIMDDDDF